MTSIVKNLNVDEKVGYLFRYRSTDTLDEIYAAIDSIEYNEVGKNILICRYIKEMTFEAIGEELGYSCAHIRRLHKKVIDVLEIQKT